MSRRPSLNGDKGRFPKGNKGGPGNPHARAVNRFRSALFKAISRDDIKEVVAMLVRKAKKGDVIAAKEILDRSIGKSAATDTRELAELRREADRLRSIADDLQAAEGESESAPRHTMASFLGLLSDGQSPTAAMALLGLGRDDLNEWLDVGRVHEKRRRKNKDVSAADAGAWMVWQAMKRWSEDDESGAAVLA